MANYVDKTNFVYQDHLNASYVENISLWMQDSAFLIYSTTLKAKYAPKYDEGQIALSVLSTISIVNNLCVPCLPRECNFTE